MGALTDDQVDAIFTQACKRVTVGCDEMHVHSAVDGCLSGDERDVTICKLVETVRDDRAMMGEVAKRLLALSRKDG